MFKFGSFAMKTRYALALTIASALSAAGLSPANADSGRGDGARHHRYFAWHGPRHSGFDEVCAADFQPHVETLLGFLRDSLDLTAAQQEPWDNFARALRSGTTTFSEACHNASTDDLSATERLAQAETVLEAGLAAVQHVRRAYTVFYGALDDTQKQHIDELMTRRHR
jgi:hypothetical protein